MAKAWMPMYWGDYKANTSELSMLEHGAYLQLIAHYWETGGPIPHSRRYRITGAKTKKEKNAVDFCLRFFFKSEPSTDPESETFFFHKRIEEELDKSAKKSGKARDSACVRWKKSYANAYANASKTHMLEPCETDANHNHNHNHNHTPFTNVKGGDPPTPFEDASEKRELPPPSPSRPDVEVKRTPPGHARFFKLKRPCGLELREDEWLYERLVEGCDRRKLLDPTPTLDALCRQHGRSMRLRSEWLRHPLPCRMAAAAIVETSPHVDDGVTYGLKAMEARWENYLRVLPIMESGFTANDLTVVIEE